MSKKVIEEIKFKCSGDEKLSVIKRFWTNEKVKGGEEKMKNDVYIVNKRDLG